MKKKTKQLLLIFTGIIAVVVIGFIFDVYVYGTAKVHYCSKQLRDSVPRGESLTDERFKVYTDCYNSLGVIDTLRLVVGKSPNASNKSDVAKSIDEMAIIREFMADPDRELTFVGTDLPMPYFRVGMVTQRDGGENMEAVEGWTRQVNVYEDKNPLAESCSVYQYHVDPRSHTLTQTVTRGLRPNEIEALKEKGTPCLSADPVKNAPTLTKEEAQEVAFNYLSRALPNYEEIKAQFVYSQDLKGQTWLWEDKSYKLPDGLEGRPYSHPIIRLTVFGDGQILYWNTAPLFEN